MSREKLIYIASPYAGDIETNKHLKLTNLSLRCFI